MGKSEESSGKKTTNKYDPLIYGHGSIEGITSVSATRKGKATLWIRTGNGISVRDERFTPFMIVSNEKLLEGLDGCKVRELTGNLAYRWFIEIDNYNILKQRIPAMDSCIQNLAKQPQQNQLHTANFKNE